MVVLVRLPSGLPRSRRMPFSSEGILEDTVGTYPLDLRFPHAGTLRFILAYMSSYLHAGVGNLYTHPERNIVVEANCAPKVEKEERLAFEALLTGSLEAEQPSPGSQATHSSISINAPISWASFLQEDPYMLVSILGPLIFGYSHKCSRFRGCRRCILSYVGAKVPQTTLCRELSWTSSVSHPTDSMRCHVVGT